MTEYPTSTFLVTIRDEVQQDATYRVHAPSAPGAMRNARNRHAAERAIGYADRVVRVARVLFEDPEPPADQHTPEGADQPRTPQTREYLLGMGYALGRLTADGARAALERTWGPLPLSTRTDSDIAVRFAQAYADAIDRHTRDETRWRPSLPNAWDVFAQTGAVDAADMDS